MAMGTIVEAVEKKVVGDGAADVNHLLELYQQCTTRPQSFYTNALLNRNERFNYWDGKTWDGRKWNPRAGEAEVFPWRGASDLPVPMVDGYINEDIAVAVMAVLQGNITASGHSAQDTAFGTRCTNVIKWMLNDEMTERLRETELLANYHFERGKAVLGVLWDRQVQMQYQELTLAMVQGMADQAVKRLQTDDQIRQQAAIMGGVPAPGQGQVAMTEEERAKVEEMSQLPMMVGDPSAEDRLVELLQGFAKRLVEENFQQQLGEYGEELLEEYELKTSTARRVVTELRDAGKSKFPVPSVTRNRPVFMALALDEDFFVASDTDWENAQAQFQLEWLTEEQVKARQVSHGWDADWVKWVVEHGKGGSSGAVAAASAVPSSGAQPSYTGGLYSHGQRFVDTEKLFPVLHCYEKRSNEDGVPGIYYTVIHPSAPGTKEVAELQQPYAVSSLLNYAHGEYPFVPWRKEYLSRRLDDARGHGEAGYIWQKAVKKQMDSQIDRTDLTTIPPLHHPKGRPPTKWGPGVKVPGPKADYAYADTPEHDVGATEVISQVREMADRYFGRAVKDYDPVLAQVQRQHMILIWLDGWRLAITQMFQLMQQFLPDEFYYRVVGSEQGQSIHAKKEEIQGKFTVSVKFDAQRLDVEAMQAKLDAVVKTVQALDINGITDHNKLLALGLSWIDPDVPEMILKPADAATQQELDDEDAVFAKLWSGVGVDVRPGQAYELRLKRLEDNLAGKDPKTGAPKNPAAMQRYQQDESFKEKVDNRRQQLQFQVEQRQNAVIGRLGAQPAQQGGALSQ